MILPIFLLSIQIITSSSNQRKKPKLRLDIPPINNNLPQSQQKNSQIEDDKQTRIEKWVSESSKFLQAVKSSGSSERKSRKISQGYHSGSCSESSDKLSNFTFIVPKHERKTEICDYSDEYEFYTPKMNSMSKHEFFEIANESLEKRLEFFDYNLKIHIKDFIKSNKNLTKRSSSIIELFHIYKKLKNEYDSLLKSHLLTEEDVQRELPHVSSMFCEMDAIFSITSAITKYFREIINTLFNTLQNYISSLNDQINVSQIFHSNPSFYPEEGPFDFLLSEKRDGESDQFRGKSEDSEKIKDEQLEDVDENFYTPEIEYNEFIVD